MKLQGLLLPQTEHPEGEKEISFGFTFINHLHFLANKGILLGRRENTERADHEFTRQKANLVKYKVLKKGLFTNPFVNMK